MLSDKELIQVQDVSRKIKRPITLHINLPGDGDYFETNLANIARQLQGVSLDRIRVEEGGVIGFLPDKPSLVLSNGEYSNINYMVFPEGLQFGPFLEAIALLGEVSEPVKFPDHDQIKNLGFSFSVLAFVAAGCPHCPETVRSIITIASQNSLINVSIIDALYFTGISEKYKIKSTPVVIINDGLTIVGTIDVDNLAKNLIHLDDSAFMVTILKSMIQSGRAEDAATLVYEKGRPEALLPIYISQEFSQRMGALLVMEEVLNQNSRSLDPIVDQLIGLLQSKDAGLRGDTASLLGRVGSESVILALKNAAEDPDPDVREAVLEALENCRV